MHRQDDDREVLRLPDALPPPAVVIWRRSRLRRDEEKIEIWSAEAALLFLNNDKGGHPVGGHLASAKGLFYLIIAGVLIVSVAFIVAGLGLVYLGAAGTSKVRLFGLEIDSTNVGIVSVALGALVLVVLIRAAMRHIKDILRM